MERVIKSDVSLVLLAGGMGSRFGSETPKLLVELAGRPLIYYPLKTALSLGVFDEIVVVSIDQIVEPVKEMVASLRDISEEFIGDVHFQPSGTTRSESVENGLKAVHHRKVVIHDADRPLASAQLFRRVVDEIGPGVGVVPVIAPLDSVLKEGEGARPPTYLLRSEVFLAQTPQGFLTRELRMARELVRNRLNRFTDDGSIYTAGGYEVKMVQGERTNVKLTYPAELNLLRAYMDELSDGAK